MSITIGPSAVLGGPQAQQGNEDAQCRRDVLAKSLSMEEMTKAVLRTKF